MEFRFDGVSDAEVARVRLDRLRSYRELTTVDVGRLAIAVASNNVPLRFTAHLEGRNPESNEVTARLIALDWTYLVDDREILSGSFERALQFPPGQPVDVPISIQFNMARFFEGDARALLETALALTGHGTQSRDVTLRITPTIDTAVGPIRYPVPINIHISPSTEP